MKARALLMLAIAAGAVAACDSDDDADPATTEPAVRSSAVVTSSDPPITTAAPTTSTSSTTTTLPPTTPAPTTTSPEQLKAEVAAAFVVLDAESFALLASPSLDGLNARAAAIAIPGSAYYQAVVDRVTELVANGQFIAPNQPDLRSLVVESVELEDVSPPYTNANVTVCQVSNVLTMVGPDNSFMPGSAFAVGGIGNGDVSAYRFTQNLRLTADGWRHEQIADPEDPFWPGLSACPAA